MSHELKAFTVYRDFWLIANSSQLIAHHPLLTINTTAARAQPTPEICSLVRRSPRTIRASSTVLAGYNDANVTTMLSGPTRPASRYRALASMSLAPPTSARPAMDWGIRSEILPARAIVTKSATET